jgi:hypothetical protein
LSSIEQDSEAPSPLPTGKSSSYFTGKVDLSPVQSDFLTAKAKESEDSKGAANIEEEISPLNSSEHKH